MRAVPTFVAVSILLVCRAIAALTFEKMPLRLISSVSSWHWNGLRDGGKGLWEPDGASYYG
jgi:hypothetical protein